MDARRRKAAELLLVLLLHGFLIEALIQKGRPIFRSSDATHTLLVYFLPRMAPPISDARKIPISSMPDTRSASKRKRPSDLAIAPPIETAPTTPPIDWQKELEAAAKNRESEADKNNAYRDLSRSMSPSQLDWLKQHRMEPANPGITWKSPRVEITQDGLPIVHINDQCVLVPFFLMPMVFCSIGHVEPNGDLFKHMHDPPPL